MREVERLRLNGELSAGGFGEWLAGEAFEHDVDHAQVNDGFAGFWPVFAVLAESAIIVDPRESCVPPPNDAAKP